MCEVGVKLAEWNTLVAGYFLTWVMMGSDVTRSLNRKCYFHKYRITFLFIKTIRTLFSIHSNE